jgi:hypothetical protein
MKARRRMGEWIWGITRMRMGVWMIDSTSRLRTPLRSGSSTSSTGIRNHHSSSRSIIRDNYSRRCGRIFRRQYVVESGVSSTNRKPTTIAAEAAVGEVEDRESRIARGRVHGRFNAQVSFLEIPFFFLSSYFLVSTMNMYS